MEIDDPKITTLRQKVTAAHQEFDLAVRFHEVWKPAAYDADLHGRKQGCTGSRVSLE
jgi:hypothetical protein